MSYDLVPGPCFYHLPIHHNALKNWHQVSCPQCGPGATRQCRNAFPLPFAFSAFLAPKPAELNLFSSESSFRFLYGSLHSSFDLSGIIKKNENVRFGKRDKSA